MTKKKRARDVPPWNEVARLELVVSYDRVPERADLESLIDMARSIGAVERATFTVTKPSTEELVP